MSAGKWIGASIGWSFGGPIGAIIGLALGSILDAAASGSGDILLGESDRGKRRKRGTAGTRTRRTNTSRTNRPTTTSGDFEVSLLILASIVIKADGKQDQKELDFVRNQFVKLYGKERANNAFKLFKNINKQTISTRKVCTQIRQMMDHPSRLQLLHFLFGIAKADGYVAEVEIKQIYTMSGYLGISTKDFESIQAMFYDSVINAYKVLEIDKTVADDEVKKAYRKMAKKYHPDKVVHLGKEYQEAAEEKFRQVQKAYETIQKERGF